MRPPLFFILVNGFFDEPRVVFMKLLDVSGLVYPVIRVYKGFEPACYSFGIIRVNLGVVAVEEKIFSWHYYAVLSIKTFSGVRRIFALCL